jgi:hypothetical protein
LQADNLVNIMLKRFSKSITLNLLLLMAIVVAPVEIAFAGMTGSMGSSSHAAPSQQHIELKTAFEKHANIAIKLNHQDQGNKHDKANCDDACVACAFCHIAVPVVSVQIDTNTSSETPVYTHSATSVSPAVEIRPPRFL